MRYDLLIIWAAILFGCLSIWALVIVGLVEAL